MKFKIPFTFSDAEILKRRSKAFTRFAPKKRKKIDDYLKSSAVNIDGVNYFAICYRNFLLSLLVFAVVFTSVLGLLDVSFFYFYGVGLALLFAGFLLMIQLNYPKIFAFHKAKNIEKNLIPAMQDMLVQLNSGVPLFQIMMNIADSDYAEVSEEYKKITKEINSGIPQIEAIEKYGKINISPYFRRVLWQISNGMRAGSDMGIIFQEGIKNLSQEQYIQIQSYGSKLNPMIMFYMLIAVILPALGITFLIIISSMLNFSGNMVKLLLFTIFVLIIFIQIMFLGVIKSRRPSLL